MRQGNVVYQLMSITVVAGHLQSDVDRFGKNSITLDFKVAFECHFVDRNARDERLPARLTQQSVELIDQVDYDRQKIPSNRAANEVTLMFAHHRCKNFTELDLVLDPCSLEVLEINRIPLVGHCR